MGIIEKANIIIYRIRQKGLEVFLVNDEQDNEMFWKLPQSDIDEQPLSEIHQDKKIELNSFEANGTKEHGIAVEGDWHDIPSLKSIIAYDISLVADKINEIQNELDKKGSFVSIKDAVKKVLPAQYAMLKELKDIIAEKNSVKDL
jgi:hypothetical protein